MILQNHAIIELELSGLNEENPALAQSLLSAIAVFESYGHSSRTAAEAIEMLTKLLLHKPLSELTDDPDEWNEVTDIFGGPERVWQNSRDMEAFSNDGGLTYFYFYEDDVDEGDITRTLHTSEESGKAAEAFVKALWQQLELPFPTCDCDEKH